MSHFCVLVVGEDVKKQLAPYQENNMGDCPGEFQKLLDSISGDTLLTIVDCHI